MWICVWWMDLTSQDSEISIPTHPNTYVINFVQYQYIICCQKPAMILYVCVYHTTRVEGTLVRTAVYSCTVDGRYHLERDLE